MRKTVLYLSGLLIFSLISCKEKMPERLSPQTTKIEGNVGEYFEVVQEEYPVETTSSSFTFKVKKIKDPSEGMIDKMGIGYILYDKNGNVIAKDDGEMKDMGWPGLSTSFLSLKVGETGPTGVYFLDWPESLRGAKTFKIIMNWHEDESDIGLSEVAENSDNNSSKIDEFLAEYEKLIDEYDKYLTNMNSGNVDMNQAMKMIEKAQSVQEKLQGMENEMTPAQVQNFTKLISKLTSLSTKAASINPSEIKSINGVDVSSLGL